MTPIELKALIESDATALSLARAGDDVGCTARCSEIADLIPCRVEAADVQRIASLTGVWGTLSLVREDATKPLSLRTICVTFLDWVKMGHSIDFHLPEVQGMLNQLKAAGILTDQQLAPLLAASWKKQTITVDEVSFARMEIH